MSELSNGTLRGVTFAAVEVAVDGKRFESCIFNRSALVYGGGALPTFVNCKFNGVSLQFAGAAANTLAYLSGMHQGGFPRAVTKLMDNIRQGAIR
jgi:hypothetical protein